MKNHESEVVPGSKRHLPFLRLLSIIYVVLLGGVVSLGILFYRNNQVFNRGAALVTHTRFVIDRTDSILLLSQNLQWEARNYTLLGDSNAYRKYFALRDSMQASTNSLIRFVNDNQYQHANAIKLQQQVIQLIQFTDSSLQLRQPLDVMNLFIVNVKHHITLYDVINQQIQLIKTEESRLLSLRRANLFKTIDIINRIFVASGILVLILFIGTFIFVSYHFKKRQRAEKKLSESKNRFQTLINSTRDLAIFSIDANGYILDWYAGAHNIKGYNKEEVIGKNISIFYTAEAIAAGEPEHNLKIAAEQGSFEAEGWRVRKNGSAFWADVLITALYDEDGRLQEFTKVTRDFSLHKKAEDKIKNTLQKEIELNYMKSSFVSLASHEFRTPLSTILSSVSLIEAYKTTETQDKRQKHIRRIESAVTEMVATLEEFLSLEKIEEGKVHIKKEVFNLKCLAEQTTGKFNISLNAKQEITYNHSGEEDVCLDAGFINHILNNLLSNAIKYSPEGGKIIFETFVNRTTTILRISDQGIGISSGDQKHLFERFFRASNTDTIKGTGLGLHIVKRYVDLMKGTIGVKSELGKGSVFTITLPSEN